ncbi:MULTISPECIES: DUF1543 domain-containing protein [Legionella]|uniref:DUF1543 domain-containing protein n=1 Tax=Legionella septentrionalis TaxID=2498109 RepID=A0A3S0X547_9GAMM|nr:MULTISPECIES: DUF1543 domain-containing protein [Legionella]MCP0914438.1 DUF1543 domain-containing protein [Legionella sp. 27cVA30]RUQ89496.1 DUF1543 domain-containing protein [Legionella septentrionalis]RUQ97336.1 DUF1543 domain-containing protein [Legionella septentrionalis]RUR10508.1 DUF1543 domain-containing protein [Legionella septentrionalis]RUR16128.1 DUF1543 domain-containing protein [Legionella septentrionalis]
MNLFVIYIGGTHANSLIELHDMRFVVANCIEDTYDFLRKSWWGIPASLHLDAWGVLNYADGYQIQIAKNKPEDDVNKLYFVNLGGYDAKQFTELHQNVFVVAADESEAKRKAVQQIAAWQSPHRDYLYEMEQCLDLNTRLQADGYYIHLTRQNEPRPFAFTCHYTPIGSKE